MKPARHDIYTDGRRYRIARFIALVVAPALVILSALMLLSAMRAVQSSQHEVERSYETRVQIQRVFSLLQDAETGQRGFVITGREDFLEPYDRATGGIQSQLAVLDRLFEDKPDQARRLQTLRTQTDVKMQIMAGAITARRSGEALTAVAYTSSERGKNAMDAIRLTVDAMISAEAGALKKRLAASRGALERARWVTAVLVGLLLGSLAAAALMVRRHNASRQLLMERIQQQAARQAAIFDAAMDGMMTLNPSGSIEAVNLAAERMFGWRNEELTRRDVSLLVDLAPGEGLFLERLAAGQEGTVREVTGRRRDGSTFDAEIAVGSLKLEDGVHLVAAVRDVTERKASERVKEDFISTVSHELRTPLTSIAGALGLLESGAVGEMPEKAGRLVYIARASSERLVRLINDLLDVEKIASGMVRFDLQPLDLRTAARRAVEGVSAFAAERAIVIRLAAPENPIMVRGDMDRLIQVFTNLLSNAAKFSPDNGVIDMLLKTENGRARVVVRDRGPGVPEAFRASIFGKFAQADSSSAREKGGTGLGLAISKEIVERHHGQIRLVSTTGQGAVFEVELPQATEVARTTDGGLRLLVCEDDPHAAEVLARCLEQDGFTVDHAGSIAAAEAALASGSYAALVLDLTLPDGDGLSLIQRLRVDSRWADMPVVVVTGEDREGREITGGLAIVDWIQKPVDPQRLSQSIRAALPGRTDLRILYVDDDSDLTEVVAAALSGSGRVMTAATQAEGRRRLTKETFDLVVLDIGLPDGSGLDLLADIGAADPRPSVIVYSGQEIEPGLLGRVDAVLTKSRTSFESLVETVRKVTGAAGS